MVQPKVRQAPPTSKNDTVCPPSQPKQALLQRSNKRSSDHEKGQSGAAYMWPMTGKNVQACLVVHTGRASSDQSRCWLSGVALPHLRCTLVICRLLHTGLTHKVHSKFTAVGSITENNTNMAKVSVTGCFKCVKYAVFAFCLVAWVRIYCRIGWKQNVFFLFVHK